MANESESQNDLGVSNRSGASDASIDSLDFERADHTARACAQCATPITDRYYTLGAHVLCETCHLAFRNAEVPGNAATRLVGAAALGTIAAAIGCALWMLVTQLTGYEIGLIAIAVGYIVGIAVHIGARRVGGLFYQLLAVFLTYTAIVMTYVPIIANELMTSPDFQQEFVRELDTTGAESRALEEGADRPDYAIEGGSPDVPVEVLDETAALAWLAAVPLAYAMPFLAGFENIIGILIIGFALWQAFRMNARVKIELQGPFRLEARDPTVG
jgi:hypothetical protein